MPEQYLVRHGESTFNVDRLYGGQIDTELTQQGRRQAEEAAKEILDKNIEVIYTSPLKRAHETAKILASAIGYDPGDIILSDELMERDLGTFAGKSRDEIWIGDADPDEYGIESDESLHQRVKSFLDKLPRDKNVLIVSHQGSGKMMRALTAGHPWQNAMERESVPNCHVIKL